MPATLFCPTCRQQLPVEAVPPAGTAVQCYLCGAGFVVPGVAPQTFAPQAPQYPAQQYQVPQYPAQQPGYGAPYQPPAPMPNQQPAYGGQSYSGYAPNWQQPASMPQLPAGAPPKKPEAEGGSSIVTWAAIFGGVAIGMVLFGFGIFALNSGGRSSVADAPAAAAPQPAGDTKRLVASTPAPAKNSGTAPTALTPASQASTPFSNPQPASPAPAAPPSAELSYKFEQGMHYQYAVRLDGNVSGQKFDYSGQINYAGARLDANILKSLIGDKGPEESSGTAFVVHSDGILVTCDHVVRGANKIIVHLNKQEYPARVVASDKKRDLAVLRVEARGLTPVALGNSDNVQLAEEVRAVGYPLSDVLGTSIKITRGTISGIVEKKEKLLQIDAAINPGNSGGPLFNSKGEVLGVTSSGLVGESISNVGFAVPANDVSRLLQSRGLSANGRASPSNLEGTELIRQVAPAVAFVKVTQSTEVAQSCLLDFNARLSPANGSSGTSKSGLGQALIGRQGGLITSKNNESLPFMYGSFADMVIDTLPSFGETTWDERQMIPITLTKPAANTNNSPFPGGFGGMGGMGGIGGRFGPRSRFAPPAPAPQKTEIVLPAVETTSYELGSRNGDIVSITKKYDLSTLGEKEEKLIEVKGNGVVSFDTKRGLPINSKMTLTFKISGENTKLEIPINFSYELIKVQTPEEYQQSVAASKPTPAPSSAVASSAPATSSTSSTPSTPVVPKKTATPDFGSGNSSRSKGADATSSSGVGAGGAVGRTPAKRRRPQIASLRDGKPTKFPDNIQPVTESTLLVPGQKIWSVWGGSWYPASVVELRGDKVHVAYDGESSFTNETKSRHLIVIDLNEGPPAEDAGSEPLRSWTDRSGKFSVEARFVSFDNGTVNLRKADGSEMQIAMDKLSPADQTYVRGKLKK